MGTVDIHVEDRMEMETEVTPAGAQMETVLEMEMVTVLGMEMEMAAIPVGMGYQDRIKCISFHLFSSRVLELLAKYCEDI